MVLNVAHGMIPVCMEFMHVLLQRPEWTYADGGWVRHVQEAAFGVRDCQDEQQHTINPNPLCVDVSGACQLRDVVIHNVVKDCRPVGCALQGKRGREYSSFQCHTI
jgi:hypothetical protein